jgi:hypothetical protein
VIGESGGRTSLVQSVALPSLEQSIALPSRRGPLGGAGRGTATVSGSGRARARARARWLLKLAAVRLRFRVDGGENLSAMSACRARRTEGLHGGRLV